MLEFFTQIHRCVLALSTYLSSVKIITAMLLGWDSNPGPLQIPEQCLTNYRLPRLPGS